MAMRACDIPRSARWRTGPAAPVVETRPHRARATRPHDYGLRSHTSPNRRLLRRTHLVRRRATARPRDFRAPTRQHAGPRPRQRAPAATVARIVPEGRHRAREPLVTHGEKGA